MADPFSVAASIAGVLSLGIEVCKGIIRYCDAWRGSDSEIANVTLKAEQLSNTLAQLAKSWTMPGLHAQVMKCGTTTGPAADFQHKVRGAVRRATYPFLRDSLLGMKDVLGELQRNLHTALHVAQLQQPTTLSKQLLFLGDMQLSMVTKLEEHRSMIEQMALTMRDRPNVYLQGARLINASDNQQKLEVVTHESTAVLAPSLIDRLMGIFRGATVLNSY
ncbi:hypothetical protein BJX70DRAFT_396202 [Aspergillus crustosus]